MPKIIWCGNKSWDTDFPENTLPNNAVLSGICIPMGIIGMLSPMPDYMDVHIICKQVPKGALVHTQNDGFYWYK